MIENLQVIGTRLPAGSGDRVALAHLQQHVLDRLPIQGSVGRLIAVMHQAVVASGFALLRVWRRTPTVLSGFGVEVTDLQRLASNLGKCTRIVEQATQDAGPSFSRFVK